MNRAQRAVWIFRLRPFEIKEVRILYCDHPEVGHLVGAGIVADDVVEVAAAEPGLVVDPDRGVDSSVGSDADRAARIRMLSFDSIAERLGRTRLAGRAAEIDAEHAEIVEELQVGGVAVRR